MGSPQQKAEKVAGFIQHYGIDVSTLDDILTGTQTPAADDPMAKLIDERMKPVDALLSRLDQQQRSTQFQKNQDRINEVVTFKQGHEFYDDVKNDMADMVELADKRGVVMPLQEAYDKACAMNPQVSGVMTKRLNDERVLNNGKTLQEKREAASSITGKQGGDPSTDTSGMTLRQTLDAAIDAQVG
jgi:sugar phosphate isomerase/epimerase